MTQVQTQEREKFLQNVRRIGLESDGTLNYIDFLDETGNEDTHKVYREFNFESWYEVLNEAGLVRKEDRREIAEELGEEILEKGLAEDLNRVNDIEEFNYIFISNFPNKLLGENVKTSVGSGLGKKIVGVPRDDILYGGDQKSSKIGSHRDETYDLLGKHITTFSTDEELGDIDNIDILLEVKESEKDALEVLEEHFSACDEISDVEPFLNDMKDYRLLSSNNRLTELGSDILDSYQRLEEDVELLSEEGDSSELTKKIFEEFALENEEPHKALIFYLYSTEDITAEELGEEIGVKENLVYVYLQKCSEEDYLTQNREPKNFGPLFLSYLSEHLDSIENYLDYVEKVRNSVRY